MQKHAIQRDESTILSPINGVIQRIEGVSVGSYVQPGQKLLEISPDSTLMVECYVSPRDIGYMSIGQEARFQVDAFNYNDWGMISGKVKDIYNDVVITSDGQGGQIPVFKIICSIDADYLTLKNGYKGYLKKGMTINARFKVTRRTLFQLLYDKVDDWLNPNVSN